MITNIDKIVEPINQIFIHIVYKDKKLRITGVEYPRPSGNCGGGCGQIKETLWDLYYFNRVEPFFKKEYLNNWSSDKVYYLALYWELYHLYDTNPIDITTEKIINEAGLATASFKAKASFCLKNKLEPYGNKWYFREVPEEVLEFLESLPDAEHEPAWV